MSSFSSNSKLFFLSLAGLMLFTLASSSPQCARSDDLAVNPALHSLENPVAICKQGAIKDFQDAKKAEQARHKAVVGACLDVPCKEAESILHASIIAELVGIKEAQKLACEHQQGAGLGGQ